jgi:hypothetical protein
MKKLLVTFLFSVFVLITLQSQIRHTKITMFPTYKGLVLAGYQGWFRPDKDGKMYADENKIHIDMWPDITEYEKTYPTALKLANGSTQHVFLVPQTRVR